MPDTRQPVENVIAALCNVIAQRRSASTDTSYVAQLLAGAPRSIVEKITEEACELAEAGRGGGVTPEAVHEAADLLFHVLVLTGWAGVGLEQIEHELLRRFGTSGLAAKRARQ